MRDKWKVQFTIIWHDKVMRESSFDIVDRSKNHLVLSHHFDKPIHIRVDAEYKFEADIPPPAVLTVSTDFINPFPHPEDDMTQLFGRVTRISHDWETGKEIWVFIVDKDDSDG